MKHTDSMSISLPETGKDACNAMTLIQTYPYTQTFTVCLLGV